MTPLATTESVIRPDKGWFDWRLGELWGYRDLVSMFVWRDFVAMYKQTVLGPAWHLIRPLFTTLIFTVVFGRMAGLSTDHTPPFLFYMTGNVAWTYFASCLDNTSKTFVDNAWILGKVYFHRMVIPVAIVTSNLIAFAIQLALLIVALVAYRIYGTAVHLTAWIFVLPVLVIMLAGFGLGGGIIVSAMTTRYRDLKHLIVFGVQLLMYLTPVIYPISSVPPRFRWIAQLNPLTPIVEGFRKGFLGVGTVTPIDIAIGFAVMLAVLVAGLMLFSRAERTFMDTV